MFSCCSETAHSRRSHSVDVGSPPADATCAARGQAADRVGIRELLEPRSVIGNVQGAVAQDVVGRRCHLHHAALLAVVGLPTGSHLLAHEEHLRELTSDGLGGEAVVEVAQRVGGLLVLELLVGLRVLVLHDPEDRDDREDDDDADERHHLPQGDATSRRPILGTRSRSRREAGAAHRTFARAGHCSLGRRHGFPPFCRHEPLSWIIRTIQYLHK